MDDQSSPPLYCNQKANYFNTINKDKSLKMKTIFTLNLRLIFIACWFMSMSNVSTAQSFVTTWNTSNPGVSNPTSITIPTLGAGYSYDVDWDNDGVFDEFGIVGDVTHDFGVVGNYTIRIQGDFPRIYFNNNGDRLKLISIDEWGDISWSSFEDAFSGCENLSYAATDAPDLSNVETLSGMFRSSGISTGDFSNWDLSNVTNMSFLFSFANQFNADISAWDVTTVQNMRGMFWGALQFNQPLNNWNVTGAKDMSFMFFQAEAFNQPLDDWDVVDVTNMSSMFSSAFAFNGKIDTWDVSHVTDFSFMFFTASSFNQDLGNWPISNVTDMTNMLSSTAMSVDNYDNTLIGWEGQNPPSDITLGATNLNYCTAVTARNSLVAAYSWTIEGDSQDCPFFTTTWQTNNPGTSNNTSITIPTTGPGYDYDVDWNNDGVFDEFGITGNVTHDFGFPGVYTIKIKGDFPRINFENLGDKLKIVDISRWGNIEWESMATAFRGCANLGYSATDAPDLSNVSNMASMFQGASNFNGDISNWNVTTITTMNSMFRDAVSFNQDLGDWNVSHVGDMRRMFDGAINFNQDLNSWNVSNVTDMSRMFDTATDFNGNISDWDVSTVTDMSYMFNQADVFNQDITGWNTSNVTDMTRTFSGANTFDQNLGLWDITEVTTMEHMLSNSGLSTYNYDQVLISWEQQDFQTGVVLGADNLTYCAGEEARSELQSTTNSWTITGDERLCSFITTWKTDNPGDSPDDAITIPTTGVGYDYDVDWNNDGVYDQFGINGSVSGIFPQPGTYTIRIRGDFPRIHFDGSGDKDKILDVKQWGDIEWQTMEEAFDGCKNLNITAEDAPDLSQVSDMSSMFASCLVFNADINHWNVSNVTDMGSLFFSALDFNQDLDHWDVSNVTTMAFMFYLAHDFNGDISNWNVSNVETMSYMFSHTLSFNRNLNNWDVSSVENMLSMFQLANAFNSPLNNWDVSNVSTMEQMFGGAPVFNQDLSSWDVSNVSTMYLMFSSTDVFNQDLSTWDVSNVNNMEGMFSSTDVFNQDLSTWDVSNVTTMEEMFSGATNFNQNLGGWDITAVTLMIHMLDLCGLSQENYDNTLIGWAAQDVQLDVNLGADGMTYCAGAAARAFLIDEKGWDIDEDENVCAPFITTWQTDNPGDSPDNAIIIPVDLNSDYNYDVDWDNDGVYDEFGINSTAAHFYAQPGTYTIRIRGDFPRIFFNNEGDKEKIINIDQWGENKWSSMQAAFDGCINLNVTAMDAPDLSQVNDLSRMFHSCYSLDADLNNWDVSNVTDMHRLFVLTLAFNSDLNNWDVSNVTDMNTMFAGAEVFNGDISTWDVSNVTDMTDMFHGALTFNSDISNWDVSGVTTMIAMFVEALLFNNDIRNWDVSNVTSMSGMFLSAESFDYDLGQWDITSATSMGNMLNYCGMSIENYDNTLIGWAAQNVQPNIVLGADELLYCNGEDARAFLINVGGWNIDGDYKECAPFITTWQTDNPGDSPNNAITIPTNGVGYNYDVDWNNDGIYDQFGINGDVSHIFPAPGTYTIRIRGDFPRIFFNGVGDREKIINIDQWGDNTWTSMADAFYGCINLDATASDAPNLNNVNNTANMFNECTVFNGDLSNWDVSNIVFASNMFLEAHAFNSNIANWNVSNVISMGRMFSGASSFNQDLNNWDVSSVTDMESLFQNAVSFNGDISDWDVSNLDDLYGMFDNANSFNIDISTWNVSNVSDMEIMFRNATAFNQDISGWDVSNVVNMAYTFDNATSFDQYLGSWNISAVFTMTDMLSGCGMSVENYDNTLIGWAGQNVPQDIELGADGLYYCDAELARLDMINNSNWNIVGDIYDCSALPVELIGFEARVNSDNQVELDWATASELNNDYFLIERSRDGAVWEVIAQVAGNGTTSQAMHYSTIDKEPYQGRSYYRLQQVDFDGTTAYSDLVNVKIELLAGFNLFPNPVVDKLKISFTEQVYDKIHLRICNSIGQVIVEKNFDAHAVNGVITINEVAGFEDGVYHVAIFMGKDSFTHTFIKTTND